MERPRRMTRFLAATTLLTALAACTPPQGRVALQARPDTAALLTAFKELGPKPIEDLTPAEARTQPTIADAVRRLAQQRGMPATPEPVAGVRDISVDGGAGAVPARVYQPAGVSAGPKPVILYFHGGGWVIATNDTYDASARSLANGAGAIVISVEYRKGPETRFPGAHDDAFAAYRWTLRNAVALGGDPRRVALAGESAGGNLAITTAIAARDAGLPRPVHELLVYPVASADLALPSVIENAKAKPLNEPALEWFVKNYTTSPADAKDPRLNVVAANLAGLPPTTIVLAEIDPLRSGGEQLGEKLRAAGVATDVRLFAGVTHEFFGTGAVNGDAKVAMDYATSRLRTAFMP